MKITLAQLNYTIGDFSNNVTKIKNCIQENKNSDLIIFTELAISGYYPFDLLDRADFLHSHQVALSEIINYTKDFNCSILLGAITKNSNNTGKKIYNSALLIHKGKIEFQYDKHLLPVYNIHDEARHFEVGTSTPVFKLKGKKYAVLICEDVWHVEQSYNLKDPIEQCSNIELSGIFVLNASPSNIGKIAKRHNILSALAQKTNASVVYVNQVGGNDEIVFDGSSFIINKSGDVVTQAESFVENILTVNFPVEHKSDHAKSSSSYGLFLFEQLKLGLRDYIHKCSFKAIVVGCSGGIDSALVLAVAKYAIGEENVYAITMPSIYSSEGSVSDSVDLCHNLKVKLYTRAIGEDFKLSCNYFEESFGEAPSKLTKENIQARIRGRVVMEFSNNYNALTISTGNKSEMAVGYATLYGDMNGAINLLGDLYKEDVYTLSRYINQVHGEVIPLNIIDKEPSAELSEDQKDSDSLPPYELLDPALKLYIEGDVLDDVEIKSLELKANLLPQEELARLHRLVDFAEFKRKQAPPIIRVQRRSFGLGRQLPVAQKFTHHRRNIY